MLLLLIRACAVSQSACKGSPCPSVLLFACIGAAPTGRTSVKFDTGGFIEDLSTSSTLG